MENFFERVGRFWPAGRRDLHWHILPTQFEAEALAEPYTGFARLGLAGVALQDMHCTLLHAVGLTPADAADVDTLVKDVAAYAQTQQPFTLTFDRPSVGSVAVEIAGWPGSRFTTLVDAIAGLMQDRYGSAFSPAPSRYPHMSLAYTTEGAEAINRVDLRAALAAIEGPLSGTVYVDRLHLVEQWHDGQHITWEPVAQVPLSGVRL